MSEKMTKTEMAGMWFGKLLDGFLWGFGLGAGFALSVYIFEWIST